jgi:FtsH-binding integral membrane protein
MEQESVMSLYYKDGDEDDSAINDVVVVVNDEHGGSNDDDINNNHNNDSFETVPMERSRCSTVARWTSDVLFVLSAALYAWTSYYVFETATTTTTTDQELEVERSGMLQVSVLFVANINRPTTSQVTHLMTYKFAAYMGYMLVGCLNLKDSPRVYTIWIVAAVLGMVSSAMIEKDTDLSLILNSVAVHLFLLSAFIMSVILCKSSRGCCARNMMVLYLANIVLVAGILMDTLLSYFDFFYTDKVETVISQTDILIIGMAAAGCWWLSSALNLIQTAYDEGIFSCCRRCCFCFCRRRRRSTTSATKDDDKVQQDIEDQGPVRRDQDNDDDNDDDDDDSSQDDDNSRPRASYLPYKTALRQDPTEDTANDEASVTSFWSEGPTNKEAITRSSLDNIFGR